MTVSGPRETLALFPLPTVALFPGTRAPLHVFETRYRRLVADALPTDRRIGLVAVPPEHLGSLAGDPPLYRIGCAGAIDQVRRREGGRYDLVLAGSHRFRIVHEPPRPPDVPYRVAEVEVLDDPLDPVGAPQLHALRHRVLELLERLLAQIAPEHAGQLPAERFGHVDDPTFVNVLCQLLELPAPEKQGLLEANGLVERCERLVTVLQFRVAELSGGLPDHPGDVH